MKSKKALKGSDFWLAEDLTPENAKRVKSLNEIRRNNKIKSVWTIDGKIKVRNLDDSVVMITTNDQIEQLARS